MGTISSISQVFGFHTGRTMHFTTKKTLDEGEVRLDSVKDAATGLNGTIICGYVPLLGIATVYPRVVFPWCHLNGSEKNLTAFKVAMRVRWVLEAIGLGLPLLLPIDLIVTAVRFCKCGSAEGTERSQYQRV